MPKIGIRLSDDLHRAVRVRALQEGVTLNELGRRWFEEYAANGRGLMAGEPGVGLPPAAQDDGPVAGASSVGVSSAPAVSPRQPEFPGGRSRGGPDPRPGGKK